MKKRVKLLTLWAGPLPEWFVRFRNRVDQLELFDHDVVRVRDVETVNRLVETRTGLECRKHSAYALCDLRPILNQVFREEFEGYDWWGWCDLDVVLGDLDELWGPLLDGHEFQVLTSDPLIVHGPLTILKNDIVTNAMCRSDDDYPEVLRNPDYCNYDETGFNTHEQVSSCRWNDNPSFTRSTRDREVQVYFDGRAWTDSQVPSRSCRVDGRRLVEVPTGRDLLLYHFAREKRWPKTRAEAAAELTGKDVPPEKLAFAGEAPEECPEFWDRRVRSVLRDVGPIHTAVANIPHKDWDEMQAHTVGLCERYVKTGDLVLDAGCGWGALVPCLVAAGKKVSYLGIDYSDEMIHLARFMAYSRGWRTTLGSVPEFEHAWITDVSTWGVGRAKIFGVAFCRGLEGSVRSMVGNVAWTSIEQVLRRVARRAIIVDMSGNHRVLEGV